ncbi:NAD-dependent epimerase/dehydratase family protein [Micromonospora lutea]|uniref:dTDP-glucose 4,6-dehydratase n=1 Tax=Micromonospora lutea TaxID=419825 RepID=A0ABQ4IT40_9ACTN|nr:NAD-dependent epimerase/dehydratase family protein [Micromonospora lutea]GIJ21074.1 dTDP-glucose 4,6-dehydratase [Micromonospora lutea]
MSTGSGFYAGRRVTVTGGASFIGSHLATALLRAGAKVTIADNYSSGTTENLREIAADVEVLELDLRSPDDALRACAGAELVFHLAAAHGGRGYIDSHADACAENFLIDQHVFRSAVRSGVDRVAFASSACVYPAALQQPQTHRALREDLVGPPYDPDGMYGMAKLCGELVLRGIAEQHGVGAVSCRYFTAYGPRCGESHAIMAMIARAFLGADPFQVWGDGTQVRTWIYVEDVVRLTMLAAEHVSDGSAVNIATDEMYTVRDAAELVLRVTGHEATIETLPHMPTGPLFRTADLERSTTLLGAVPQVNLAEGVRRTAEWYFRSKERGTIARDLPALLVERG